MATIERGLSGDAAGNARKLADVQHKLFVREQEPKIEQEGRAIFAELSQQSIPDEVLNAVKEEGYEKDSVMSCGFFCVCHAHRTRVCRRNSAKAHR